MGNISPYLKIGEYYPEKNLTLNFVSVIFKVNLSNDILDSVEFTDSTFQLLFRAEVI